MGVLSDGVEPGEEMAAAGDGLSPVALSAGYAVSDDVAVIARLLRVTVNATALFVKGQPPVRVVEEESAEGTVLFGFHTTYDATLASG
jgi:hypothetical protein